MTAASRWSSTGGQPQAGDITLCAYCTNLLRFDAQMVPRRAHEADLLALFEAQPELAEIVRRAKVAILLAGPPPGEVLTAH